MDKFFTDEELKIKNLQAILWLLITTLIIIGAFLIESELAKPITCTPDYCYDDFCIILKGEK